MIRRPALVRTRTCAFAVALSLLPACVEVPDTIRAEFAGPKAGDRSNFRPGPHGFARRAGPAATVAISTPAPPAAPAGSAGAEGATSGCANAKCTDANKDDGTPTEAATADEPSLREGVTDAPPATTAVKRGAP